MITCVLLGLQAQAGEPREDKEGHTFPVKPFQPLEQWDAELCACEDSVIKILGYLVKAEFLLMDSPVGKKDESTQHVHIVSRDLAKNMGVEGEILCAQPNKNLRAYVKNRSDLSAKARQYIKACQKLRAIGDTLFVSSRFDVLTHVFNGQKVVSQNPVCVSFCTFDDALDALQSQLAHYNCWKQNQKGSLARDQKQSVTSQNFTHDIIAHSCARSVYGGSQVQFQHMNFTSDITAPSCACGAYGGLQIHFQHLNERISLLTGLSRDYEKFLSTEKDLLMHQTVKQLRKLVAEYALSLRQKASGSDLSLRQKVFAIWQTIKKRGS
ncbi:MAG: hypothetical protein OXC30_03200 [Alphaproteobacteria bacterium]|nr:hypothetical protein [Alphaproteobacteria bacterium]